MNRTEYNALPVLISRKEFRRLSGLNDRDLRMAIARGEIQTWRRPPRTYWRRGRRYRPQGGYALYLKADLLKFSPLER